MSETPQPNWYPDPYGQAELRWWDGAQWTEYTHGGGTQPPQAAEQHDAAHQATALAHEGRTPKRKKTWLIVTASVAALALVAAGAIAIPALIGGQNFGAAEPVIANGIKYMPPVTLDVAKDDTLHPDLDSVIVLGDVTAGGGHAWNRVSIDGTWKSLDPTWNDSESSPNKYLLINESEYVDSATRTTDPADNWILDINKSKYDTP